MSDLNRRRFLGVLAAATIAGVCAARWTVGSPPRPPTQARAAAAIPPPRAATPPTTSIAARLPARVALPGGGVLNRLPPKPDLFALTLDDGVNSEVVRLYTQFAKDAGVRLTYFVNGTYKSWTDNLSLLRPLVDSGQIQLANHTWSHPDLTNVSKTSVAQQITRNHDFLKKNYGVDAAPYFRPPYGRHSPGVDAVAADLGYIATTMWSGTLADSTVVTEDFIVKMAKQYFTPQSIVLGHLNHMPVTHVYPQLLAVIRDRRLRTVTLDDVFLKPA